MFGGRVFGFADRHQLNFLELVLADIAPRILPRRTRLRTETRGKGGQANWQCGFGKDLLTDRIGQRNLSGGNQPAPIGGLEVVLGELWQLPSAEQRFFADQQRSGVLGVAVHRRLMIEHELPERPLQPRHLTAQKGKPRARNQRAGFEVEAECWADVGVFFGGEIELARVTPSRNFDVLGFAGAIGNVVGGEVGK